MIVVLMISWEVRSSSRRLVADCNAYGALDRLRAAPRDVVAQASRLPQGAGTSLREARRRIGVWGAARGLGWATTTAVR